MTDINTIIDLNPSTAAGSVILNIIATVGAVAVLGLIGWLSGQLRWLVLGYRLKRILSGRHFVFVFNPIELKRKVVTFLPNGEIGEGNNRNEHAWRIRRGKLEILALDGNIYSCFAQDKNTGRLNHTNDSDTRSIHGQYFQPNFQPWVTTAEQDVRSNRT